MNIIFTKKSIASIIIAIMLLGITSPVFATFKKLEFTSMAEIDEVKEYVVDGQIEMEISEDLIELEGLPIYNESEEMIGKLKLGTKIYMLAMCIENEETMWIEIELENGEKAYINLFGEPIKEEVKEEPKEDKEPIVEQEEPVVEKEEEKVDIMDSVMNSIMGGTDFITEMHNMFKDTLGKVFENNPLFKDLQLSEEEQKLVEEVKTDFSSLMLKLSKVALQVGTRWMTDFSKTFFDKIFELGKENEDIEPEEPEAEKPEAEKPEAEEPEAEKPEAEKPEAEEPEAEKPEAEEPEAEKPEVEEPEAEEPEAEKPEAEKPKEDEPLIGGSNFLQDVFDKIMPNANKITNIFQNVTEFMKPIKDAVGSIFGSTNGLVDGFLGIADMVTNVVGNFKLPFVNLF